MHGPGLTITDLNKEKVVKHLLKVAFNNICRVLHNLPTYCSASEMFTVNRVADCKAVIRNLVHRFVTIFTISKHLLVRSILSSDL